MAKFACKMYRIFISFAYLFPWLISIFAIDTQLQRVPEYGIGSSLCVNHLLVWGASGDRQRNDTCRRCHPNGILFLHLIAKTTSHFEKSKSGIPRTLLFVFHFFLHFGCTVHRRVVARPPPPSPLPAILCVQTNFAHIRNVRFSLYSSATGQKRESKKKSEAKTDIILSGR